MTASGASDPVEILAWSGAPEISVVIPHFSESRTDNLKGLLEELRRQTVQEIEVILVRGVSPQGRAINMGARRAKGKILVVLDDDSRIGHDRVLENLRKALREDPSIGMAGASVVTPDHANAFQKTAAGQFPRFHMPVVDKITDSDFPCHGCAAFPMAVFEKIGMEREEILRGLDPDLRVRLRAAHYRVVLVPDTFVYHPLPDSFRKFMRVFFRNGYGSAYIQKFHPHINYDTDETVGAAKFVPKRSFLYRAARFPLRLVKSLATGQWIRFAGYSVYLVGYATGYLRFTVAGPISR